MTSENIHLLLWKFLVTSETSGPPCQVRSRLTDGQIVSFDEGTFEGFRIFAVEVRFIEIPLVCLANYYSEPDMGPDGS